MKNVIASISISAAVAFAACTNRNATPAPTDPKAAGTSGHMMNAGMNGGHMMGDGDCPMMGGNPMMGDGGMMMGGGAMSDHGGMGAHMMSSPMHGRMMNTDAADGGCPMTDGGIIGRGKP
jgi:hypothetical protein